MTALPLLVAGAAWLLLLLRPGWTGQLARRVRPHRRRWVTVLAGLAAVAAVDPLISRTPVTALAGLVPFLTAPALAGRLTILALGVGAVAVPLVADVRRGPQAPAALAGAAGAGGLRAAGWLGGALAAGLAARGAAQVWSAVAGGELSPPLRLLAGLLLGTTAPAGSVSHIDPRLPAVLYWMAGAAALAGAGAGATRRVIPAWNTPWRRAALGGAWGLLAGCMGFIVWRSAAGPATDLAPLFWWGTVTAWGLMAWPPAGEGPDRLPEGRQSGALAGAAPLLLIGVLLLAVQLRWGFLVVAPEQALPLSLDAQSYFDEAVSLDKLLLERQTNGLALFFSGSTWFREPFYIYLLHAWLQALGPQEVHVVFLSLVASVVWVGASAWAVGALVGSGAGLLTALLLAVDAIWIRNAAVGLREEVTGTLLVLAVASLWSEAGRRWGLYWLAPLLAGAAALTRLDALPCALFILLWGAVTQRWSAVRAGLSAALLAAILLPTFAGYARARGDVAPAATAIATNNWKEEFKHRLGEPGFEPDRRVSPFDYLFRYHTPGQLLGYTAAGYARIYGQEVFESHYYLLTGGSGAWGRYLGLHSPLFTPLIFLAGTLGLLRQRERRRRAWLIPGLCVVGVLPPIGFVAGVPGHSELYQARYAYMVAPFAAAAVAWALVAGGGWVAGRAVRITRAAPAARPLTGAWRVAPAGRRSRPRVG